jgi:3-hydroxyisobutyrate dehydrogenase-like beta-hydroxyacid dehydrogenase
MGSVIAARLRAAGHRLALYDPALPPGEGEASLADACRGSAVAFLCLPDAAAVEASRAGLEEAAPPIVVDLTSSLPATTRRVAAALALRGVEFVDCPLSGGVAGARAGTLTAMAGGDLEVLARVRPVLAAFASNVLWAGPLGSGHAAKALNNALSAVSLTATAEALVTAVACGVRETVALEALNAGPARSQNSEVKYPRDVLPRTYAAGFTAGLMEKDLATALGIAADHSLHPPLLEGALAAWREVTAEVGADADFTRVHAVVASRSGGTPVPGADRGVLELLGRALSAVNLLAATEAMRVAEAEGLDRRRVLEIVNVSTGRSEATREGGSGALDAAGLRAAAGLVERAGTWAPLTTLAAALVS